MNKRAFFSLILIILLVCGCVGTSDDVIKVTKEVSNFDRVSLSSMGELVITQGDQESVTIEAPSNVINSIETEVRDGTLHIRFERGFPPLIPPPRVLRYNLTVREITGLVLSGVGTVNTAGIETEHLKVILSGVGTVTIDMLNTETLDVTISGGGSLGIGSLAAGALHVVSSGVGSINVAGEVAGQDVLLSGLGSYNAGDLRSQTARVRVAGAGSATVWAADSLDVRISGVGRVAYYGDPSVTQGIGGVGSVRSLGSRQP